MNEQIYKKVVELQDKVQEQGNLIADMTESLNELARLYESMGESK